MDKRTQRKIFTEYLHQNLATASMASRETGISEKNICRLKRKLEKEKLLWKVEEKLCKVTNRSVWYLTTNPKLIEE